MEDTRRRQLHSCDPCRKGKRRCDAPKNRKDSGFSLCSNCKRWKKECTFDWVSSKRVDSLGTRRKGKTQAMNKHSSDNIPGNENLYELPRDFQWHPIDLDDTLTPGDISKFAFAFPSPVQGANFDGSEGTSSSLDQSDLFPWGLDIPVNWQTDIASRVSQEEFTSVETQTDFYDPLANALVDQFDYEQESQYESSPLSFSSTASSCKQIGLKYSSAPGVNRRSNQEIPSSFCISSEQTANQYARSTMTRNLIRIYHDSMENALSCWLTEHNCPYSDSISTILPTGERKEWGPNWSNRMCIRVCQLDRVSSSIRGRALSGEEDRTAARVLHLAIIAFASQWTQHAAKGTGLSVPEPISRDERSIREYVWNEARHALEHSTRIPSFRVIFANIIFSLTQSPLDHSQDIGLGQLLENDGAPTFLEAANRQLYTFRHKGSIGSTFADDPESLNASEPRQLDPILASQEHRSTLGLLFWLGIMFDTLSAAMYQRPLVVSDEDSQISSGSPAVSEVKDQLQRGSISQNSTRMKKDVWDDFFLQPSAERDDLGQIHVRWPCSYEEAAAVLSEATPVKVLLYRRVTQLQTLVYRGASSDKLEEIVQKTLLVYQHWNYSYQRFMLDCVENHELLPSRIQSWYVILDGHWHLSIMLLADTIEGIDKGRLGSEHERVARKATNFVSTLRTEHAFAVGSLARASLQGQNPSMYANFHDSLNEVAFLVEPWTVVLIHSFAKSAHISIESLNLPGEHSGLANSFKQNCEFCICALQYLGRKSDMAFMVARNLSRSLSVKVAQMA
ncbi:Regulatory protein alcR [Penicillium manginii]|uniref:Regulatory protein alcR n=1 Tax=Penicillium manginii TaxID=203109 RepID=UPI002549A580|nr:Regulatory protein alcR [Penicillium manginii]KAJ5754840.1 Regulatory protein alcR [Penicillium manginii]